MTTEQDEKTVVPITKVLRAFTDKVYELSEVLLEQTGKQGLLSVTVTEEVGHAIGCVPGTPTSVLTSAGMVEVVVHRASSKL